LPTRDRLKEEGKTRNDFKERKEKVSEQGFFKLDEANAAPHGPERKCFFRGKVGRSSPKLSEKKGGKIIAETGSRNLNPLS